MRIRNTLWEMTESQQHIQMKTECRLLRLMKASVRGFRNETEIQEPKLGAKPIHQGRVMRWSYLVFLFCTPLYNLHINIHARR
jgi:hypothetical protein